MDGSAIEDSVEVVSAADLLRDRLIGLRRDALRQLAASVPIIDSGLMRVIADASVVLAVLDEEPVEPG